jgi:hypothetical protein
LSTHNFNKAQFLTELLPFIYDALHPEIQDTSMSLMAPESQDMMIAALELMTIINTKMIYDSQNSTPKFEPDLTQLAVSGR